MRRLALAASSVFLANLLFGSLFGGWDGFGGLERGDPRQRFDGAAFGPTWALPGSVCGAYGSISATATAWGWAAIEVGRSAAAGPDRHRHDSSSTAERRLASDILGPGADSQ